jgi:hypothetical protein
VGPLERLVGVGAPTHRDLVPCRPAALVRLPELVDQVGIRLGGDDAVTEAGGELHRLRAAGREGNRHRSLGQVEHSGVLDCEVRTTVVDVAALPQQADDLDGLGQHLVTHGRGRPPPPDDVLVEPLAGPQPQGEAPVARQAHRRRLLGDDCGVVADDGAGHHRHQPHTFGHGRHRSEHRPAVGRVLLLRDPRVVVVGRDEEVEPHLLGTARVGHELAGAVLLGHQRVAEPRYAPRLPRPRALTPARGRHPTWRCGALG